MSPPNGAYPERVSDLPLGAYIFNIKREDARRALEALYLEEGTDPRLVLEELRVLRFDLDEYIRSVEDELARGNGTTAVA